MKPGIKRFLIHLSIIVGIIVAIILFSQWGLKQFTRHNQALTVPNFAGLSVEIAKRDAKERFLQIEVIDSLFLPNHPRGVVLRQIPQAGENVKKNRRILVTINSVMPRKVKAPSLVGFSLRQAKAELSSQNLQLGTLYYENDFATNTVLEQMFMKVALLPGTPIDAYSVIDLVLGVDPEYNIAYVPNLLGLSYEIAKDIITDHYLNVGVVRFDSKVQTASDSLAAIVIRQDPTTSNTFVYNMGSLVNLTLSLPQ